MFQTNFSRLSLRSLRLCGEIIDRSMIVAAVVVSVAVFAGCGFHLRGSGGAMLPPDLSTIRVVPATAAANDPFTVAVRDAVTQAGAKIVTAPEAPALVLLGEKTETRVSAVSTATAKASQYLLLYSASFRVEGPQPIPAQTIRLQRSYSFNPTQVLAREQQEQELLRDMRRDAAQQIVRRLARAAAPGK
jgi:LPS-assembly lipoprotein